MTAEDARPGTPPTARGRRTRDAIVDAAADLMHERGIAATGVGDVLAASGTGKSQLYHYFGGKSDLVLAVIDRQLERVLAAQPALDGDDVRAWARSLFELHRDGGGPFACPLGVFSGQVDAEPRWREHQAAAFARWQDRIAALLAAGQRDGTVDATRDAGDMAVAVLAAVQGGLMLARLHRDLHVLCLALGAAVDHVRPP
ncbi:putative transcriptional regulator, TetR family protein [Actinomycetospora sp. NBRC 106375]|uniref:TetR/AcrR family transcriptional regulator n=1 Tax=Actinomycetospora sp. NBRC 106375 TaxID=3032207 RepID=UPI0024A00D6E|nr:TetR/AcrR family transcriptional regulator [Actinomycetospora sp. NBRC 106375]GLZ45564.1 putative transcriptional regulator, TetR family protein [Actinomycetospora sp. NBRC 106375]